MFICFTVNSIPRLGAVHKAGTLANQKVSFSNLISKTQTEPPNPLSAPVPSSTVCQCRESRKPRRNDTVSPCSPSTHPKLSFLSPVSCSTAKPCRYFQVNRCPHTADVCDFAHVIVNPAAATSHLEHANGVCQHYATGHCSNGAICGYPHVLEGVYSRINVTIAPMFMLCEAPIAKPIDTTFLYDGGRDWAAVASPEAVCQTFWYLGLDTVLTRSLGSPTWKVLLSLTITLTHINGHNRHSY